MPSFQGFCEKVSKRITQWDLYGLYGLPLKKKKERKIPILEGYIRLTTIWVYSKNISTCLKMHTIRGISGGFTTCDFFVTLWAVWSLWLVKWWLPGQSKFKEEDIAFTFYNFAKSLAEPMCWHASSTRLQLHSALKAYSSSCRCTWKDFLANI